jgi:heme-degrading monooxygenase HmoA
LSHSSELIERKPAMPYGRCVIYSFSGDAEEVTERSRNGILPIFKQQPGFIAYGVMVQDDRIISMSAWASESDARAADDAAKEWVSHNLDVEVISSFVGDYAWLEFADSDASARAQSG